MAKDQDIQAWRDFLINVKAIGKKDPGGSYFGDLLPHEELVASNIKSDIMPFVGIYTTDVKLKAERETYQKKIQELRELLEKVEHRLNEAKKWDTRELNKRRKEIEAEKKRLADEETELERKQMINL
jgi:valyl-tRNA synthetase